ncbi:MarR family winged helix-turn-helix transcriptional regulator [Streptomyces sp. NPDC091294]|uniref:MarR family winged helix-turn-helix transcriptional regulator n=1 Tax=Streptomyces sp. NPDC091294 TaxID=3365992 RepID=UPI00380C3755
MADAVDIIRELWRSERPDLDTWPVSIVGRVQRLSRILERELKAFDNRHGLESGEFDVLTTLRRSGPPYRMTAGAFLKASMVTSGAITKRIDRMEARGLVERVRLPAGDRRSVQIRLTDKGIQLIDELFPLHLENEMRLLQALSAEEAEQLAGLLRRLLESFGDTSLN